jgi:hypothetical protein
MQIQKLEAGFEAVPSMPVTTTPDHVCPASVDLKTADVPVAEPRK